jgi:AcrR family transcriptional regulator
MARIVKDEEYAARRNEILDAALRLVYTKGYEQMTIQDILNELQISKGAFYHYFDSKSTLLEALVERIMMDQIIPLLLPIVQDDHMPAIQKLERYFDTAARWKANQKAFMLALLRVWVADENAIVRQKLLNMSVKQVTPQLSKIIRQGVQEGVFTNTYPDQVCQVIIYIIQGLSDTIVELLFSSEVNRDHSHIASTITVYVNALTDAMERVLGAKTGSLHLIDPEVLKEWFTEEEIIPKNPESLQIEVTGS